VDPERLREFIRKAEALLEEMNAYGSALDPTYSFEEEGDEVNWYHYD
jgi:hypothetical protein